MGEKKGINEDTCVGEVFTESGRMFVGEMDEPYRTLLLEAEANKAELERLRAKVAAMVKALKDIELEAFGTHAPIHSMALNTLAALENTKP